MYPTHFWMADLVGIPPVPIGAGAINFCDSMEKRQATFKVVDCSVVDPNKVFGQDLIIRRIAELELLAHEHSVNTATALEATFQEKRKISATDPEYASNRAGLCYHLTQSLPQTPSHTSFFALCD